MRVERVRPSRFLGRTHEVTVVIDVLRAASTAIVLLDRGVDVLHVVATPSELRWLPSPERGSYLVFSEIPETEAFAERVDNSPVAARTCEIGQRRPVLVTTNGTRALGAAVSASRQVLVAGFLNITSVCRHLARQSPGRVTLLPAGDFANGQPHVEDECCSEALEILLGGGRPDFEQMVARCLRDDRIARRLAAEPGLRADFDVALTPDASTVVPEAVQAETGCRGHLLVRPLPNEPRP